MPSPYPHQPTAGAGSSGSLTEPPKSSPKTASPALRSAIDEKALNHRHQQSGMLPVPHSASQMAALTPNSRPSTVRIRCVASTRMWTVSGRTDNGSAPCTPYGTAIRLCPYSQPAPAINSTRSRPTHCGGYCGRKRLVLGCRGLKSTSLILRWTKWDAMGLAGLGLAVPGD